MASKEKLSKTHHSLDQRYLSLLDSLGIGFMFMDMDFNILEVNKTFQDVLNITKDMLVGHHASEFYTKKDFQALYNMDLKAQKKSQNYQYEFFTNDLNTGEKIPVIYHISTNHDESGKPVSQYVFITDIREQKKIQAELQQANSDLQQSQDELKRANENLETKKDELEREKQMLETILFGIGDCVTIYDDKGQLLLENSKGEKIRKARKKVSLPLDINTPHSNNTEFEKKGRHFSSRIETVKNKNGQPIAYAEIVKELTERKKLVSKEKEIRRMKRTLQSNALKSQLIGRSSAMQKIFELILRCSEVDSTVLVLGETGVGKELVAKAIHRQSKRRKMPFVAINCGALPKDLLESELFGHDKGAFTGATSDHSGLFREADGGTLLLDEVGDLDINLQVKVLRALQEKEVRPVGGKTSYPIDVRVIAATHHNLAELVDQNQFRSDLYYQLAVIPLYIPPLRERKDDILLLAKHFITKHNKNRKAPPVLINHEAQQVLLNAVWGGNIRELENAIEYALAMKNDNEIKTENLPVQLVTGQKIHDQHPTNFASHSIAPELSQNNYTTVNSPLKPWQQQEKQAIELSLIRNKGNRTKTANELNMSRSTLWRKMTMYRI